MADITVTAANVSMFAGGIATTYTAGAAITAGQLVYLDSTDSDKAKLADADAVATAAIKGIALNTAPGADQPVRVQTAGDVDPGGTVTVGEVYVASTTAGGIAPLSDLLTGDFVSVLGVGITASKIGLCIKNSGVAKP